MKNKSRYSIILGVLFGYVLLQFIWWEILLVRQTSQIIEEQQKIAEITTSDFNRLKNEVEALHHKKNKQTIMIVGEGTVFLLLLVYGLFKIKQSHDRETELGRQQNNFFLSITHELKTPIAATKLQIQTLLKQNLDDATRQELLKKALAETERLNLLIDNVLLASRLENGQVEFTATKCDFANELKNCAERYYKKLIVESRLILSCETNCFVMADHTALVSVITNLIGNAVKYSPAETQIRAELFRKNNSVFFVVKDNGYGISDEDKTRIFNRFYRAGNEETRSAKGTGLGLYIVKYILDKHQVKIRVKNNEPHGSIFETEWHAAD